MILKCDKYLTQIIKFMTNQILIYHGWQSKCEIEPWSLFILHASFGAVFGYWVIQWSPNF